MSTRWLRSPVFHFVGAGAALFVVTGSYRPATPAPATRPAVVITAAQVDELRATFTAETGRPPGDADAAALVERAVDDELLYREALARGLDRGDRSIRNRVVEKMRALGPEAPDDPAALLHDALALGLDRDDAIVRRMLIEKMRLLAASAAPAADDAELHAYLDAHVDRYRTPPRVSLRHVFLATSRGATLDRDAGVLLARLRGDHVVPDDAVRRGDPFPLGSDFRDATARDLARSFGPDFARAVIDLPLRTWSEPVGSPYGRHLVWLDARQPGDVPPLAAVRSRVLEDWREAQREDRIRAVVAELRTRYDVRIERRAS